MERKIGGMSGSEESFVEQGTFVMSDMAHEVEGGMWAPQELALGEIHEVGGG